MKPVQLSCLCRARGASECFQASWTVSEWDIQTFLHGAQLSGGVIMSRVILCVTWMCIVLVRWAGDSPAAEIILPQGNARASIVNCHFPCRMHAFVWRNWNAVAPAKLAKILGTSVDNVNALAASMGLPPAGTISPEMKTRGYVTLIRRNWHLLPYDQLLELLDMTTARLAFVLREDDFLLW